MSKRNNSCYANDTTWAIMPIVCETPANRDTIVGETISIVVRSATLQTARVTPPV